MLARTLWRLFVRNEQSICLPILVLLLAGCGKPPPPPPPPPVTLPVAAKAEPKPVPKAAVDTPSAECAARDRELAESFAPYVDAFSNRGLELSPDGKSLLFLSDRGGGSYQLYVSAVDKPGAEPVAIAPAKDGVADARFSPDGLYLLFTRDRGKDENTQIFRATVDGKEVIALTKESDRFHFLPRVAPDWRTLVYFRGKHKSGEISLVTQPIEGGAAKSVLEVNGFHFLSDLSPDGKEALCTALLSMSRSQLFAVELKSGKRRPLAPKQAASHAHSGVYSADGKSVFLVSDEESERAALRRIDAQSGAVQATFSDPTAEVADVVVPRKGGVLAVLLDHGSHSGIKLLDTETLKERSRSSSRSAGPRSASSPSTGAGSSSRSPPRARPATSSCSARRRATSSRSGARSGPGCASSSRSRRPSRRSRASTTPRSR